MTDKQIEEKLQEIENKDLGRFKQHKLQAHLYWSHVVDTDKLTWGFHHHFLGNLPANIKIEVSKLMNKLAKGGYKATVKEEEKQS